MVYIKVLKKSTNNAGWTFCNAISDALGPISLDGIGRTGVPGVMLNPLLPKPKDTPESNAS